MTALTVVEQVRWQDLKVMSELDMVLDIAKRAEWGDCEVFGYGDMITEPQESMGWKLIPADLYKDSIPPQAVERLHQIINAGIRVRGVIIADDERRMEPAPASAPTPTRPKVSRSFVKAAASWIGKALLGLIHSVRTAASFAERALTGFIDLVGAGVSLLGKVLFGLIRIAAIGALVALGVYALFHFFWPILVLGFVILMFSGVGTSTSKASRTSFDPKLVILVDNGSGGTTWVSLYTWYD